MVRFYFEKLVGLPCRFEWVHLPHIWYDPDRLRRYFCKGWE